jgi:hypothetical protein
MTHIAERQEELEPRRFAYAKKELAALGITIDYEDTRSLKFNFKGSPVTLFPYSGWHTCKTIQDGRGVTKLLKQLK